LLRRQRCRPDRFGRRLVLRDGGQSGATIVGWTASARAEPPGAADGAEQHERADRGGEPGVESVSRWWRGRSPRAIRDWRGWHEGLAGCRGRRCGCESGGAAHDVLPSGLERMIDEV